MKQPIFKKTYLPLLLLALQGTVGDMAIAQDRSQQELSILKNATQEITERNVTVVSSVTCGYIDGQWLPGSITRRGEFQTLKVRLRKTIRTLQTARKNNASAVEISRLAKKVKKLRVSLNKSSQACRTINANPNVPAVPTVVVPTSASTTVPTGTVPTGKSTPTGDTPPIITIVPITNTATPNNTIPSFNTVTPASTPSATGSSTPVGSATPTPTPGQTVTVPPASTSAPTLTATPILNPIEFEFSLIDPCTEGTVRTLVSGNSLDLQETIANSRIQARIVGGDKSLVSSIRLVVGSQPAVISNSADSILSDNGINASGIPNKLLEGNYTVTAIAFSGLNGLGSEIGRSNINITVSDTNIVSKGALSTSIYKVSGDPVDQRIFTPREIQSGCIRAGTINGPSAGIVEISNHSATDGIELTVDATKNWSSAKVGIGYGGEVAISSIIEANKLQVGFYDNDRSPLFGLDYSGVEDEIFHVNEPKITLSYLFLSGFGWNFGGTSSYLIDFNHAGEERATDFVPGPFPAAYYPDNIGGLYGVVFENTSCDIGNLFHVRESELSNPDSKRYAEISLASHPSSPGAPCIVGAAPLEVVNGRAYSLVYNGDENGSIEGMILSRYSSGLPAGTGPIRDIEVDLPYRAGLRSITVLDNGTIAALFHTISSDTIDYGVSELALDHNIVFYSTAGLILGERTVSLPFAASGIKAVTGGKLVLYGPNDNAEQLEASNGHGNAYIALVY
jgi:hypothetical protein